MPYCIKCGLKNEAATKFCIRCGTHLVRKSAGITGSTNGLNDGQDLPVYPGNKPAVLPGPNTSVSGQDPESSQGKVLPFEQEAGHHGKNELEKDADSRFAPRVMPARQFPEGVPQPQPFARPFESSSQFLQEPTSSATAARSYNEEKASGLGRVAWTAVSVVLIAAAGFGAYKLYENRAPDATVASRDSSAVGEQATIPAADQLSSGTDNTAPPPPDDASPNLLPPVEKKLETGSDEWYRGQVAGLYAAENKLSGENLDLSEVLQYYEFPLERYYTAKRVDAGRLMKLYTESYAETLAHHQLLDYQNKMTVSKQGENTIKVIVGSRFAFSTKQSPDSIRSRLVYNVYVLNANGKITSVYQLL